MKLNSLSIVLFVVVVVSGFVELGLCSGILRMATTKTTLGGVHDCKGMNQNSAEIESLARFAVQEHNKKENALLEFARVLKAKEQVVAGKMYYLTLEAVDAGKKRLYEAKIWVKPWMNFKELQEFKHARDSTSYNPSGLLGVKQGH